MNNDRDDQELDGLIQRALQSKAELAKLDSSAVFNRVASLVATVAAAGLSLVLGYSSLFDSERGGAATFEEQIESLNQMEESAVELIGFVESQRGRLEEAERVVAELREEQETLEPLVSANRQAVEAMFVVQERRQEARVWLERWIGFLFGVAASLVASLLITAGRQLRARWNTGQSPAPTAE